ncbi:MAG TPA: universal stress protein [Anaerolineales bacterium]|nr:universal stress protein [Anaerolineales bacterium]
MTTVLCPTRGGKESQPNQDFAIQLASEQGANLLFLYVSDISFISRTGPPIVVDIEEEMAEVGDFLLAMAQERAEKAGVHAKTSVRSGNFTKVLRNVILEKEINTVVLGGSNEDTGVVTHEHLQLLSKELGKELNVEFIVVHRGELIFRTRHST